MTNKKTPKNDYKFICYNCCFKTNNKKDFSKHELTRKHNNLINPNKKTPKTPDYTCKCGKKYKHISSLSNHIKNCNLNFDRLTENKPDGEIKELKTLIIEVIKNNGDLQKQNYELQKQNQDFQKQVLEVCKSIQPNITNSNNNNKTFNLQFFLNEQCKDAMNISEFINSFKLTIEDLERVGTLGYVDGISSIILKELRSLDIHKRPLHCSDTKRETLYIKDENKWEKEDHENKKIKNVIKSVEHKNIKMINEWTKEHSSYKASDDKDNDKYLKIVMESAGGIGDYREKGNKIIKKIVKEVAIEK